jgi:ligand-binding SRPBCC domain-containing protein
MIPNPPAESIHFQAGSDGYFHLKSSQTVARCLDDVFAFFSRPENLQQLTPTHLNFKILTPQPIAMENGSRIDYALRLHGIPIRWKSIIEDYNPPHAFVDRQLSGPYREWIHLHSFHADGNHTRIEDHVRYKVPGGHLAHRLFVQPSLRKIFAHRHAVIQLLFP